MCVCAHMLHCRKRWVWLWLKRATYNNIAMIIGLLQEVVITVFHHMSKFTLGAVAATIARIIKSAVLFPSFIVMKDGNIFR